MDIVAYASKLFDLYEHKVAELGINPQSIHWTFALQEFRLYDGYVHFVDTAIPASYGLYYLEKAFGYILLNDGPGDGGYIE
jgi:hypothetical protein